MCEQEDFLFHSLVLQRHRVCVYISTLPITELQIKKKTEIAHQKSQPTLKITQNQYQSR